MYPHISKLPHIYAPVDVVPKLSHRLDHANGHSLKKKGSLHYILLLATGKYLVGHIIGLKMDILNGRIYGQMNK
jgi:hypothetical protein